MSVSGISGNKQNGDRPTSGKGKFQPVNINSQFAGKSLVTQKAGPAKYGLQSLGKQSAVVRRLPPPANLPSLKAESSGQDPTVNLVPSGGQGWGNQEPPTSSADTNAQQKPQTQNYQKGAQSISSGPGGGGVYGGGVQPAVGGTTRGGQLPDNQKGWSSSRGVGEGDSAYFAQSSRDFPTLAAAGDAKAAGESGAPSLRPQKFGSWKSGGGGAGSKGLGSEESSAHSPTNGAQEEISPAPSPGIPPMDHPPPPHYPPQQPYPQRMYPGATYPPPGPMPPPNRAYLPPPGYGGTQGGMYPPYPPPNGQYPPQRPQGYGGPRGPIPPPQHPASMYNGRYGAPYGPPPNQHGHDYPPRDVYPPPRGMEPRDEYAQRGGGRPPPVGNGMERRGYQGERRMDRGDNYSDYNDNDRVVWSDDEGTVDRGNRQYDYRPANREPESWSDPEQDHQENRARPPPPEYDYNDRGRRPMYPPVMGHPQGRRERGFPPPDWYHPQAPTHMRPNYGMEGPRPRGYPHPQMQRGPVRSARDVRDIDDEEDEERRRQLQQNAEREAAIERSRQQRRIGPQSSLASSTGGLEASEMGEIGGRQRPESGEFDESDREMERPSSRDEHGKAAGRRHGAVPPRFQRHNDGVSSQPTGPRGRGEYVPPAGRKPQDSFEDPYSNDYYGGYSGQRNGQVDSGYRGHDRSHRGHDKRDDERDRREDYRQATSGRKEKAHSDEKENEPKLHRPERPESKDSQSSGGGRSSEKSHEKKERAEKQGKSRYAIEAPTHPATVREEDTRVPRREQEEEDDVAPMQVLSKPAAKVVKRTVGGTPTSSRKGDSRKSHSDKQQKSASQHAKDGSSRTQGGAAGGSATANDGGEQAVPAKNVWEQRKEERESQEREAKRTATQTLPAPTENRPEVTEQGASGHPMIGNKRPIDEDTQGFRGGRGGAVGRGGGMQRGGRTREFISQSRRLRGASAGVGRASRGRGMSLGTRRGGSVPTGPGRRSREENEADNEFVEEAQNEENEKKEEREKEKPEEEKKELATAEDDEDKEEKAPKASSERGSDRGRGSARTTSRRGSGHFGGGLYADPRMMRQFYFPFVTPSPFPPRGRGGRPAGMSSFFGGRGRTLTHGTRGRGAQRRGATGWREPPDRGRRKEDEEEEEEGTEASGRPDRGGFSSRQRANRGVGSKRRGSPAYAAQAKSPNQSEGQDEWETASESSDVGRKKESVTKKIGGPQRFSAQRRDRGGKSSTGSSGSQRPSGSAGTVTWGPGSGPNRGNKQHSGRGGGQDNSESKNVNPASRQESKATNRRNRSRVEEGSGAQSNTFKPDALAGVDFNNVAGVVIIDNQPDVVFDPHLDGFQEVVSRKEKRLRKEKEQASDVPEQKSGSPQRRDRKGHGKPQRSSFQTDHDSKERDKEASVHPPSKTSRKPEASSFVSFSSSGDGISEIGTWESTAKREGAVHASPREQKSTKKAGTDEIGRLEFPIGNNGFDSVVFDPIGVEGANLPSKTGVEIWGTPDPAPFVEIGQDSSAAKDIERPAPAKSVEFPADMTFGSGGELELSEKFDFTFDPNLPTVTGEENLTIALTESTETQKAAPKELMLAGDVELKEKLISVRGVWEPETQSVTSDDTAAIVSSAASMVSAALYKQQNQAENQQNLNAAVGGKSSLAKGPNVAKVRPQQQQQTTEFIAEGGAATVKLPSLNLVDINPQPPRPSGAPSAGADSINSPILTPPAAASFFGNALIPSIRPQPRVQQVDFTQPPPALPNFQQPQPAAQVTSIWPPQMGNPPQIFSAAQQQDMFGRTAAAHTVNATNPMFISTSIPQQPPMASPPSFLTQLAPGPGPGKGMPPPHGTAAIFGQQSQAYMVQEPTLMNLNQPPPPMFGAIGSQRGNVGHSPNQQPQNSFLIATAAGNPFSAAPGPPSLLGPPPTQAPSKLQQPGSLSPFSFSLTGLGKQPQQQPGFNPAVAPPPPTAPGQQPQFQLKSPAQGFGVTSLMGVPRPSPGQAGIQLASFQKIVPGPGMRPGSGHGQHLHHSNRSRRSGTPNSTNSASSGMDTKARDGDLLQQIDQFLNTGADEEEMNPAFVGPQVKAPEAPEEA